MWRWRWRGLRSRSMSTLRRKLGPLYYQPVYRMTGVEPFVIRRHPNSYISVSSSEEPSGQHWHALALMCGIGSYVFVYKDGQRVEQYDDLAIVNSWIFVAVKSILAVFAAIDNTGPSRYLLFPTYRIHGPRLFIMDSRLGRQIQMATPYITKGA
jgi:hypothetical protein